MYTQTHDCLSLSDGSASQRIKHTDGYALTYSKEERDSHLKTFTLQVAHVAHLLQSAGPATLQEPQDPQAKAADCHTECRGIWTGVNQQHNTNICTGSALCSRRCTVPGDHIQDVVWRLTAGCFCVLEVGF